MAADLVTAEGDMSSTSSSVFIGSSGSSTSLTTSVGFGVDFFGTVSEPAFEGEVEESSILVVLAAVVVMVVVVTTAAVSAAEGVVDVGLSIVVVVIFVVESG